MDKEFDDMIETRCELALQKNQDYLNLQNELANAHGNNDIDSFSEISFRMLNVAVNACYKLGIKDMQYLTKE